MWTRRYLVVRVTIPCKNGSLYPVGNSAHCQSRRSKGDRDKVAARRCSNCGFDLVGNSVGRVGLDVRNRDVRVAGGWSERDGAADSVGGTGYDRCAAVKLQHTPSCRRVRRSLPSASRIPGQFEGSPPGSKRCIVTMSIAWSDGPFHATSPWSSSTTRSQRSSACLTCCSMIRSDVPDPRMDSSVS